MKVLLLPYNVASDISHKVRLLRSTGIDARGFSVESSNIQTTSDVKFYRIPLDGNRLTYRLKRSAVYARMWQILSGAETDRRYARLKPADRTAILEILRETKKDLPASFKG